MNIVFKICFLTTYLPTILHAIIRNQLNKPIKIFDFCELKRKSCPLYSNVRGCKNKVFILPFVINITLNTGQ